MVSAVAAGAGGQQGACPLIGVQRGCGDHRVCFVHRGASQRGTRADGGVPCRPAQGARGGAQTAQTSFGWLTGGFAGGLSARP